MMVQSRHQHRDGPLGLPTLGSGPGIRLLKSLQSRFRTTTDGGTGGLRYDTWQSPWLTSWQRPRSRQMSASGRSRRHRGRRLCRRSELITLACGNAPGRADADQAQKRQEEEQSPHNHHHDGGRHLPLGGKRDSEGFNGVSVAAFEALASHRLGGRRIPGSPYRCKEVQFGRRQLKFKLEHREGTARGSPGWFRLHTASGEWVNGCSGSEGAQLAYLKREVGH